MATHRPQSPTYGVTFPVALIAAWLALLPAAAVGEPRPPAGEVVATIDGAKLTLGELVPTALAHQESQLADEERRIITQRLEGRLQRHQTLAAEVERAVNDRVLAREAAANHTTPAALLDKVAIPAVTAEEAHRVYDEHARQINQPYETVEQQLLEALQRQHADQAKATYLGSLRAKYRATIDLDPPRFDVAAVGPSRGPADAPVVLVLFADFQCPFCTKMIPALDSLLEKHPSDVRLVYRHFPLTGLHPNAMGAALASVCAAEQDRFWPAYQAMYKDTKALDPPQLRATLIAAGLDGAKYDACLTRPDVRQRVDADVQEAERIGLSGTPALFVNGILLRGSQTSAELERVTGEEIARHEAHAGRGRSH